MSAQNAIQVSVGPSPWSYTAPSNGLLCVQQVGSLSGVSYMRNGTTTPMNGAAAGRPATPGFVPVYAGDTVIVTYSAQAPTLLFIPEPK